MKKLSVTFFLFCLFVFSACSAKTNKTIEKKHADYGFVCPQIVLQSGITFGLTNKFPTLKDFVNEDFLNDGFSLKEVKKEKNNDLISVADEYYVYYDVEAEGKVVATYMIGYLLNDSEKTVSFQDLKMTVDGEYKLNIKCPEYDYTDYGMRRMGEFYGAINQVIQSIFNMNKVNEAIN